MLGEAQREMAREQEERQRNFPQQGGNIAAWGGKDLRMLDHFFMGPNLVRGFAPAGRITPYNVCYTKLLR